MSEDEDAARVRSLGDILAERSSAPPPEHKVELPSPWLPRSFDKAVCAAASHAGEDAATVLREFHGNSALARTLRNLIGVTEFSPARRVYMMRSEPRPKGMTRADHDALIAAHINSERDPLGAPIRAIDAGSVKALARRGKQEVHEAIVNLFDPSWDRTKGRRKKG